MYSADLRLFNFSLILNPSFESYPRRLASFYLLFEIASCSFEKIARQSYTFCYERLNKFDLRYLPTSCLEIVPMI